MLWTDDYTDSRDWLSESTFLIITSEWKHATIRQLCNHTEITH